MILNKKKIYVSLSIIVISYGIFILFKKAPNQSINQQTISSITYNGTLYQYNRDGTLTSTTTAKKITNYKLSNNTILNQPRMTSKGNDGVTWYASADLAINLPDKDIMKLQHNVVLHQPGIINHPETTITTSESTIYPKQSLAITHHRAKLIQPGTILQGDGAIVNMKSNSVKLLHNSQGSYLPKKNNHV